VGCGRGGGGAGRLTPLPVWEMGPATDRPGGGSCAGIVLAAGGGAGQVGELMSTRAIALPTDSETQRAPSAPRVMPQGPPVSGAPGIQYSRKAPCEVIRPILFGPFQK